MKNLLKISLVLCPVFLSAQCEIWGKGKISNGDTEVYTVNKTASCADCYQWEIPEDVFQIQGERSSKDIILKAMKDEKARISVQVKTASGSLNCQKEILISENPGFSVNNTTGQEKKCDIEVSALNASKTNQNEVSFTLNQTQKDFRYNWTITYANGENKQQETASPRFALTSENPIRAAKVVIRSSKCTKEFNSSYEPDYWFPKQISAPQQSYQQSSYSDFVNKNGASEQEQQVKKAAETEQKSTP